MAIIVYDVKRNIIDRTIPELIKKVKSIHYDSISHFLYLLKQVGADIFEIDRNSIESIINFSVEYEYAYRITNIEDLKYLKYHNSFKYVILNYVFFLELLSIEKDIQIILEKQNIILEIDIINIKNADFNKNSTIFSNFNIQVLRVSNLSKLSFEGNSKFINSLKSKYDVLIDFCANNKYYMATAIIVNACIDGVDMITTEFNSSNYASMEEVIVALKSIVNADVCGELYLMNDLARIYESIINEKIYTMKPILGEDIFKYESGIHADGIAKKPENYEPFNPALIGKHRQLYIGKHSGKAALVVKFQELNLDCEKVDMDIFLELVREKSVKEKRNILDEEIVTMYEKYNTSC